MIAIDTGLLVCAHRAGAQDHAKARKVLERAAGHPSGWGLAQPCLVEFWSLVTHPACAGGSTNPSMAKLFLERLLEDGKGQVWGPGQGFEGRLLFLAEKMRVKGPRIHDLQVGLMALEGGATELWTRDAGFVVPNGLLVVDPFS